MHWNCTRFDYEIRVCHIPFVNNSISLFKLLSDNHASNCILLNTVHLIKELDILYKSTIVSIIFLHQFFDSLPKSVSVDSPHLTVTLDSHGSCSRSSIEKRQFTKRISGFENPFNFLMNNDFAFPLGNYKIYASLVPLFKNEVSIFRGAIEHLHNYIFLMRLLNIIKKVVLTECI